MHFGSWKFFCLLRTKFVYSEPNLCTLVKIFGICTFGICEFLLLYSTTAVCVHFHFWQKKKSKTKKLFFVVVPLHYCCCAYTRLGWTDGQMDRQTDGRTDRQLIRIQAGLIVCLSVRLSVCPSVRPSIPTLCTHSSSSGCLLYTSPSPRD